MVELWVAKLDSTIYFDTKGCKDIFGLPRYKDERIIYLTEEEEEQYISAVDSWNYWQNRLANA
jgi:hypothetical protein